MPDRFRVWSLKNKNYPMNRLFVMIETGVLYSVDIKTRKRLDLHEWQKKFLIERCIGRKDVVGKPVYVNDVCIYTRKKGAPCKCGTVVFNKFKARFEFDDGTTLGSKRLKVVGNAHFVTEEQKKQFLTRSAELA